MKAIFLSLFTLLYFASVWSQTQTTPSVQWQEVGPYWYDPYSISPVYVQRIDFTYDKSRSSGNFSSKTLTNQIVSGFLTTIKSHNYTYFKNVTFEDGWFINWFDELKVKNLLMPPSMNLIQPFVTESGQLIENWATRASFKFGKKDLYQKEFLYWTEFKIPIAKCKEVHVRENFRQFKVPFVASILLSDGQKQVVSGNYHLTASADIDVKTRDRECPFKLAAQDLPAGVIRTELKPSGEAAMTQNKPFLRRSELKESPTPTQGANSPKFIRANP